MYGRLGHLLTLLWLTLFLIAAPVRADDNVLVEIAPDITVTLEGNDSDASVIVTEDGQHYLDASPILQALGNDAEFDGSQNVLTVRRSQDGVVMSLYTDTGVVAANGKELGSLKTFGEVDEERVHLTPNALSVMTGLLAKYDEETKTYALELDPRLKAITGFDLLVEDIPLINLDAEPVAIGPVLLLPLRPIAAELGHELEFDGQTVTVTRAQDSAAFTLDLQTGLVSLSDRPLGVVRDITYARPSELLIPASAIETLTGTHVDVSGSQVHITLDGRLQDLVMPSSDVGETIEDTPFTAESLAFQIGPQQVNRVDFNWRARDLNGRVRVELPDFPTAQAELEPSWLSLDFAHGSGLRGSLGDVYAANRELDGVGVRRVRGVTANKRVGDGRLSATIGVPVKRQVRVSDDQTRAVFGGFAAGVRYQDADGWEAGLGVRRDNLTQDQIAVLSAIKKRHNLSPDIMVSGSASIGVFDGPTRDNSFDLSADMAARVDLTDEIDLTASVSYQGTEFLRTDFRRRDQEVVDEDFTRDEPLTTLGQDSGTVSTTLRYAKADAGVINNLGLAATAELTRNGVFSDDYRERRTLSASASATVRGVGVATSLRHFRNVDDGTTTGRSFDASLYKPFEHVTVRAAYSHGSRSDGESIEQATVLATLAPKTLPLPKGASVTMSPTVSAALRNGQTSARAGIVAQAQSGELLGRKNIINASLGVVQGIRPDGSLTTDEFLTISANRRLRIGDNMALGVSYASDLGGDHRIGLTLQGRYDFNPAKRLAKTKSGTGVLTGQVFVDANRDGIKQPEEISVPGIVVRIAATRLALRTDGGGSFTIQNIKNGLHDVRLETDRLPLGYSLSDDAKTRVSIADGKITHIDLPIVHRGQLRGFVYEDENANGVYDRGEARPDGKGLMLRAADQTRELQTAAFGQFAFDDLAAQTYELVHDGTVLRTIDLTATENLMGKIAVALPSVRLATNDPPTDHTAEPAPLEPAP